jgi:hypothetical protein
MKARWFAAAALTAVACQAGASNVDVGVSIGISQPGVYGRIDIGRFPQPQVIYNEPVIVRQPRAVYVQPPEPVYMWVPQGHRQNWKHYCGQYRACGAPVVFVRHDWYRQNVQRQVRYDDRYDNRYDDRHDGNGHGKGKHGN